MYYQLTIPNNKVTLTDGSFKIFTTVLGAGLTILVLDQIWKYEERRIWKAVKEDVLKLLSEEINGIFTDMATIMVPIRAFTVEAGEDIVSKTNQYRMDELNRLAGGAVANIENRLREEGHLLKGEYGKLFDHRFEDLNDMEIKYGKFLEPKQLKPLINLERLLKSLAGNIRVALKLSNETGAFLVPSVESKIFYRVHEILKVLMQFKELGLLKPD